MDKYQWIDFHYDALTVLTKPEIMHYHNYAERLMTGFVLRQVCKTFYQAINSHGSRVYPSLATIPSGAHLHDDHLYHTTQPWYNFASLVWMAGKIGLWDARFKIPAFLNEDCNYELASPDKMLATIRSKGTATFVVNLDVFKKKLSRRSHLAEGYIQGNHPVLFTRLYRLFKETNSEHTAELVKDATTDGAVYDRPWAYFKTYDPEKTEYTNILPFPVPMEHWKQHAMYERTLYFQGAVQCLQALVDRSDSEQLVTLWKNLGRLKRNKGSVHEPELQKMRSHFEPQYKALCRKKAAAKNREKREELTRLRKLQVSLGVDGEEDDEVLSEVGRLVQEAKGKNKKRERQESSPEEARELTASMSPAKKAKTDEDPMEIV
jgi:hypothetical protein